MMQKEGGYGSGSLRGRPFSLIYTLEERKRRKEAREEGRVPLLMQL